MYVNHRNTAHFNQETIIVWQEQPAVDAFIVLPVLNNMAVYATAILFVIYSFNCAVYRQILM